jgi:fructose-bisphosphate aldolase, class I
VLLFGDHIVQKTAYWTERVFSFTFCALNEFDVCLEAALLEPNMVNPGSY